MNWKWVYCRLRPNKRIMIKSQAIRLMQLVQQINLKWQSNRISLSHVLFFFRFLTSSSIYYYVNWSRLLQNLLSNLLVKESINKTAPKQGHGLNAKNQSVSLFRKIVFINRNNIKVVVFSTYKQPAKERENLDSRCRHTIPSQRLARARYFSETLFIVCLPCKTGQSPRVYNQDFEDRSPRCNFSFFIVPSFFCLSLQSDCVV